MGVLHDWQVSVMPRQEREVTMFTTTTLTIFLAATFLALVCAAAIVDYVYYYLIGEGSYLYAYIATAILVSVPLVILLGFLL
jgi:hypothetical protein